MLGGSILPRDEHRLQAIRERDTRGEDWTLNGRKKSKHEYNIDKYHNVNLFSTSQICLIITMVVPPICTEYT